MPLPDPNKSESEQDFVARCIAAVVGDGTVENTADGRAQGAAMCFRQYRDNKPKSAKQVDCPMGEDCGTDAADPTPSDCPNGDCPMRSTTTYAYSRLQIKSINEDQRFIVGMATTPATDMMEDIVDPKGAQFNLPIPFLYMHDSKQPIGHVKAANVTDDGIEVGIQIAKVTEPGKLKDRLDEAWQSIKHGLVRGLSIGFKDLESDPIKGSNWGRHIKKWSWLELSAVVIPANSAASITVIKQIDRKLLAAIGKKQCPMPDPGESQSDYMDRCTSGGDSEADCADTWDEQMPGDTGKDVKESKPAGASARSIKLDKPKVKTMAKLTIGERIANLEATRAANTAALEAINQKVADEGRTKDAEEQTEFDDLYAKIEGVDRELADCRKMQKINIAKAVPVDGSSPSSVELATQRSNPIITVKSRVPPENLLPRAVICKLVAHREHCNAADLAKQHYSDTPEVELWLKTAVAAGTTTDATWASPLALVNNLPSAFIEFLWATTVLSRIQGFTMVPFNVRVPRQTGNVLSTWVGEGASKPVGKLAFDTVTLRWAKTAAIIVFTQELAQFSNPAVETIVRNSLAHGIAQFLDTQFFDPSVAVISNVSPASITNGAANDPGSGTDFNAVINDIKQAFAHFTLFNIPLGGLTMVMRPDLAVAIGMLRTPLGSLVFPEMTSAGGNLLGMQVLTTQNVPAGQITIFQPSLIFMAQDGGISVDVSTEASIQGDTAPATPPTSVMSLWQQNMVGIRAERYITWQRAIDASVYYITSATYGGIATAH